jgi:hypothetical protein
MTTIPDITAKDIQAIEEIRHFLLNYPTPYGQHKLDDLAMRYAQELVKYPPSQAMAKAKEFRDRLKALNEREEVESDKALARRQDLKEHPIYNVGRPGLISMITRSMLASINGTPFDAINWFEVTDRGLVLHTPVAAVSERVITSRDLQEKRVELGVDPAAYFDRPLAWLKQLRFNVQAPWGRISFREPGSGLVLGEVVTFKPEEKLASIRAALATLARAADPYARHKLLPSIADFLGYYLDDWIGKRGIRPL